MAVAEALSDLVVYTKSVKFISFSHSKDNQNYCENTSMAEKKARKLAKASGRIFFIWSLNDGKEKEEARLYSNKDSE